MSKLLPSYPKIYSLHHEEAKGIFNTIVDIEEKVDGSQISFGLDADGVLRVRSKSAYIDVDHPPNQFSGAIQTIKNIVNKLKPGWIYRGECLQRPKHNVLAYDRIPTGHIILFDIQNEDGNFVGRYSKEDIVENLGLEYVPLLGDATILESQEQLEALLERDSILGGQKIEGVVIKPITPYYIKQGEPLIVKYVSDKFKEVKNKISSNTKGGVDSIVDRYRTVPRWNKAIQHLEDQGLLTHSLKDMKLLVEEVQRDTIEECKEEIMEQLWAQYRQEFVRGIVKGLAQYYEHYTRDHGIL